mgnify:CR=1 FL=1|jgi:hypothetical protein|tara:strand:+ start:98 stop:592 length:495 start_codon:yes stop_codon:yes gene_type:complete
MKTSITFDFFKLSKFLASQEYRSLKSESIGQPTVKAMKKFIKAGNVTPQLADATKKTRKFRKTRPSIGGHKPLYDTGALVNGIMYDKGENAIVGLARGRDGKHYTKFHLTDNVTPNGKPVPARNFVQQTHDAMSTDLAKSYFDTQFGKKLLAGIKRNLSRRLAR